MCLKHRNTGSPKSHYTLNEVLKISQETKFIHIFSIDKGVVEVVLARLAIKFQCLEDLLYASRGALAFSTTFSLYDVSQNLFPNFAADRADSFLKL